MRDPAAVREAYAFLSALKQLKILTAIGDFPLALSPGSQNCYVDLRGITGQGEVANSTLPTTTVTGAIMISGADGPEWFGGS
jgi:hypothetical protein